MKLNYTVNSIRINSEWFDILDRKENVYQKITYKGLNLFFQLYKFRLHRQENDHTFMTSIAMLRKVTGYTTQEIFELLKKMKSAKIINMENLSRWDYLLDENKNIKDKELLYITATDVLPIDEYTELKGMNYIYVPLSLFQMYEDKGLNEKYYALYCLIKKWSNNKEESKMWMSIAKMSEVLKFDKDYINQMIYNLNRNYFLASTRKTRSNGKGWKFEHYILDSWKAEKIEEYLSKYKDKIEILIKRVDTRKKNKKKVNIEDEMEILEEQDVIEVKENEIKNSFGQPKDEWKKQNNKSNEVVITTGSDENGDYVEYKFSNYEEYEKFFSDLP